MAGEKNMMTPEETAQYMRKSLSWVYKNADLLGGRKLGGSLFFSSKGGPILSYIRKKGRDGDTTSP
jgi:hypothetical protein